MTKNKSNSTTEFPITPEKTYFSSFCEQYHVTDENNTIKVFVKYPGEPKRSVTTKIFSEDKEGNLDILVYTLDGELIPYDHKNATPDQPNINLLLLKTSSNNYEYFSQLKILGYCIYLDSINLIRK